jgi:hypothetical protein
MRALSFALLLPALTAWSVEPVTIRKVDNHHGWGWSSYVLGNGLVTLAVVPAIGGRVMQYDLGAHPFLFVNPAEVGRTYEPAEDAPWRNFGGYKTWVAPQQSWKRGMGGWPPAPHLDHGAYTAVIEDSDDHTVVLATESPVESFPAWQAQGLRLARRYTLFRGSTRVKVEQAISNLGDHHQTVSIWDVTQMATARPGADDQDRFWVYFPVRRQSAFGARGFMVFRPPGDDGSGDSQWKTWEADRIAGVQYLHRTGKIGSDSDGGWITAVDERDGYTYAKRFAFVGNEPGQFYPEGGLSTAVFTSGGEPYVEVEVMSPLVDLPPKKSFSFIIDWYSAKIGGPVLAVSEAGAIKRRLTAQRGDKMVHVTGAYGVFHEGTIAASGLPAGPLRTLPGRDAPAPKVLALGSYYASPTQPFVLDVDLPLPSGLATIVLTLLDAEGQVVGELDRVEVPAAK